MSGESTQPHIPAASESGSGVQSSPRFGMRQIQGYQIIGDRPLAEPSMGAVWKAVQLSTKREVALKLISPAFLGAERILARFEREVELAANLEHPNIARVYDSGLRQGVYCYAMEFIPGKHLDAYVVENRLNQRQILELMEKVCRAIQHAHQRGIIHADLKPSNILATADGEPHVLDFGLAKLQGENNLAVSRQGRVRAGTPPYMSPEQVEGNRDTLDIRSDVYALGVILYELLLGQSPYDRWNTDDELYRKI